MIRSALFTLAVLTVTLSATPAPAQQTQPSDEIVLIVTALSPDSSITLGAEPATIASTAGLYPGEPLAVEVKGGVQDVRETMLRIDALGANLLAIRAALELETAADRALTIRPRLEGNGLIDVYHEVDSPPIRIAIGPATVTLGRGVVRVRATGESQVQIICASGTAEVGAGAAKVVLDSRGKNSVMVRGAELSEAAPVDIAGDIAATRSRVVQQSLLRDLVRVAESAAEGDIEPPARGSAVPIAAIATAVRVVDIVPRGSGVTTISGGTAPSSGVAAQGGSTADAFLSSGQAALAVVGARIQATRIVGGTAGRAPLGVNNQFRRRFTLGPVTP